MNGTIHQIHLGDPMAPELARMCQTVRDRNPDTGYKLWGAWEVDRHLNFNPAALKDWLGNWACVSNFLRLHIINQYGGLYLDTDIECFQPLDVLFRYPAFSALQDGERHCNAVFGAHAGHPWVEWQIANFERYKPQDAASGVYLMTDAPRAGVTTIPTRLVYPWLHTEPAYRACIDHETLMAHHWKGSWCK